MDWSPRLQTSDAEMERIVLDAFEELAGVRGALDLPELEVVPTGLARAGEALSIDRLGGRFTSIVGAMLVFI
ncbi:MAG: hypothetical protein QF507_02925 [Vicinamibacterales bacterium]|nr:hypothetical protein [Vicinamibacterales bacterium]